MREIEIKARVEGLGNIRAVLEKKGLELSKPVTHHDVVWGLPDVKSGSSAPWLRLRTETKSGEIRHLFTLKRSVTGQLDSIEHETEVFDPVETASIVRELGFTLYSDITKTRQKARVDEIEICLDSVDGLGEFIELERLAEDEVDYQVVADQLWTVLEGLDVPRKNEITDGYDVLVNKKLGKE